MKSPYLNVAIATVDAMSWPFRAAGPVASAAHPRGATHIAIPAIKRRAAAATVASVDRGSL
jgi:hypothetical protein